MIADDWRVVDERGDSGCLYIDRGPDRDFLQVNEEDDARLIAAAPDLLAAAKVVLAGLNAHIDSAPANAVPLFTGISALHDAIAKAGG